jgi:hypothetical protein
VKLISQLPNLKAWIARWLDVLPSLIASFVLHLVALLVLGLIVFRLTPAATEVVPIEAVENDSPNSPNEVIDRVDFLNEQLKKPQEKPADNNNDSGGVSSKKLADIGKVPPIDFTSSALKAAEKVSLTTEPVVRFTGEMSGRSGAARSTLLKGGGTGDSERAVTLGLR